MRPTTQEIKVPPTKPAKQPTRSVQIDMAADLVADIDRIAATELLSRSAWLRRVISNTVKYSRWQTELSKRR